MLIERLKLENILSFGPDPVELELQSLNVLIGPNGSGKSNLIEIIDLLRSAPSDISRPISKGGGVAQWIWQGKPEASSAKVEAMANPTGKQTLRYAFEFMNVDQRFHVLRESLENIATCEKPSSTLFERQEGSAELYQEQVKIEIHEKMFSSTDTEVRRTEKMEKIPFPIDHRKAVLSEIRHPQHPQLDRLAEELKRIKVYREWFFGRNTPLRRSQQADLRNDVINADATNLGLVLSRLRRAPETKRKILDALRRLYDGITDYDVIVEGGTVQIFIEEGDISIPASRLSDGTLRFLCLLAILCDPNPPPLVCIEEPELGLHPDALALVADILVEASERTQLIVTTHSDALVSALTNQPDSIVVCEKLGARTEFRRLVPERLSEWLEEYLLGDLWRTGELGGNP